MTLPELVRRSAEKQVRKFCEERIPTYARHEVRLEHVVRGNAVTIFERRPFFRSRPDVDEWSKMKVAQLRYDLDAKEWSLYWADRNGRWHRYWDLDPAEDLNPLLREIDEDPTAVFWGEGKLRLDAAPAVPGGELVQSVADAEARLVGWRSLRSGSSRTC